MVKAAVKPSKMSKNLLLVMKHLRFIIHVTSALGMLWLSRAYYIYGMDSRAMHSGVQHGALLLFSLQAATSHFSILIGQKMQLTGWHNGNEMCNVICMDTQTSIEWLYCLFSILWFNNFVLKQDFQEVFYIHFSKFSNSFTAHLNIHGW